MAQPKRKQGAGYLATTLMHATTPTTALEGYVQNSEDGLVSAPIVVPWAVKGAGLYGLYFKINDTAATAGTIQPKLQVTFNYDAQTPTWVDVPEDAGTTTAIQLSAALTTGGGTGEQAFEWYGCHIPGPWYSATDGTTNGRTTEEWPNVAVRVSVVGSSANLTIQFAKLFLIESTGD
jgi:hypothetical protein